MGYMVSLIGEFARQRKLIWDLAKADFKKRFVGSYFGIIWMFIQPIVTVLVYYFVFGIGFKSQTADPGVPFVLWLVAGIVPWFYFGEVMTNGTNSLQEYNYLVKKMVFRVEMLPVIKMLSCLLVHLIFTLIMAVVFFGYGRFPSFSWIQVLYYMFAVSMFSLALIYFTSAINVFFKDMTQIVGICLQFGMWLTPIMWEESRFAGESFFPALKVILRLNPMYYIAAGYRDSLLYGTPFWSRSVLTIYFWGVTAILFFIGLKVFKRLRPHFSDVL